VGARYRALGAITPRRARRVRRAPRPSTQPRRVQQQELNVIKSGGIHYKHAEIEETSVRFIGETAILLSKLRLDAVVGGNEATNPFTVTEVYLKQDCTWNLASLSFTRLLR
jgi:hypothetical protein